MTERARTSSGIFRPYGKAVSEIALGGIAFASTGFFETIENAQNHILPVAALAIGGLALMADGLRRYGKVEEALYENESQGHNPEKS